MKIKEANHKSEYQKKKFTNICGGLSPYPSLTYVKMLQNSVDVENLLRMQEHRSK